MIRTGSTLLAELEQEADATLLAERA